MTLQYLPLPLGSTRAMFDALPTGYLSAGWRV
jgi:hypothetical protein